LRTGVNVLDMAHAYETFASGGKLIYGSLSPGVDNYEQNDHKGIPPGPVGIQEIEEPNGSKWRAARLLDGDKAVNHERAVRVLPQSVAETATSILQGVVRVGSGKRAALGPDIPVSGKTGTTEDYGDAWFVGWTPRYTTAVWIGYPDEVKSMKPPTFSWTDGEPVAGGTWPAYIWATYMKQAMAIYARRHPEKPKAGATGPTGVVGAPSTSTGTPAPVVTAAPTTAAPKQQKAPKAPETPTQQPAQEQQPAQQQPTDQGGGVGAPSGGAAPPDQ
jgi:penicillin-binding protein 1A